MSRLAEHLKASDKPYHARSMSWAQRLKRVFNIDITECEACEKTNVKIIACITEPAVIHKLLAYLDKQTLPGAKNDPLIPPLRAPPDDATCSDYIIQHDFDFGAWSTKTYHYLNMLNVEVRAFTYLSADISTKNQFNRFSWWQLIHWFLERYPFNTRTTSLNYSWHSG